MFCQDYQQSLSGNLIGQCKGIQVLNFLALALVRESRNCVLYSVCDVHLKCQYLNLFTVAKLHLPTLLINQTFFLQFDAPYRGHPTNFFYKL